MYCETLSSAVHRQRDSAFSHLLWVSVGRSDVKAAIACSGMQWHAVACSGMQWHAVTCSGDQFMQTHLTIGAYRPWNLAGRFSLNA